MPSRVSPSLGSADRAAPGRNPSLPVVGIAVIRCGRIRFWSAAGAWTGGNRGWRWCRRCAGRRARHRGLCRRTSRWRKRRPTKYRPGSRVRVRWHGGARRRRGRAGGTQEKPGWKPVHQMTLATGGSGPPPASWGCPSRTSTTRATRWTPAAVRSAGLMRMRGLSRAQGRSWETNGRPDVPTQCGGRRHAVACRRPPYQPKRHVVVASVSQRYSTLNPRVRGSSPWRRTLLTWAYSWLAMRS